MARFAVCEELKLTATVKLSVCLSITVFSSLLSTPSFPFSLFLHLSGRHCANRSPFYCSDSEEGPAVDGYEFHKALGSTNVFQSRFSTWLNIILEMLRWHSQQTQLYFLMANSCCDQQHVQCFFKTHICTHSTMIIEIDLLLEILRYVLFLFFFNQMVL